MAHGPVHPPDRRGRTLATKQLVERKLRELIRRLAESGEEVHGSLSETLPEPRIIQVVVPDLPATYWTEMAGGQMSALHRGPPAQSDIRIRVASEHLVDLVDGRRSLFSSYLSGQVKIEASLSDLLRLRRLA
jgi:predicted lipid carrier protein YhbT